MGELNLFRFTLTPLSNPTSWRIISKCSLETNTEKMEELQVLTWKLKSKAEWEDSVMLVGGVIF